MPNCESLRRCPKCGCANGHNCAYERCVACGERKRASAERTTLTRDSLSEALLVAA